MSKTKSKINKCPLCESNLIGRLSNKSYYCQDCNHELFLKSGIVKVFYISSDGDIELIEKLKYCC
ncbi:MAG: hypothetical protein JM58_18530 [Peptococcaceae bacterium BICA1-8]|nr:MAG: hypothetical protein JM58_18530 [Peptococcaceae bacterium BICA1-8]